MPLNKKGSDFSSSSVGITFSAFFPKQPRFLFFFSSFFTLASLQKKSPFWMEMPTCWRLARSGTSISSANRKRCTRWKETEHSEMLLMV